MTLGQKNFTFQKVTLQPALHLLSRPSQKGFLKSILWQVALVPYLKAYTIS